MIRLAQERDFQTIFEIINDAAVAYKGVIPNDRWHEPYMTRQELQGQLNDGVIFYCLEIDQTVVGVMGLQQKNEVDLIRHAYVRTLHRQKGFGGKMLEFLKQRSDKPLLIGTWKDASWAIDFYLKHGFTIIEGPEKERLLRKYWNIPERQIETSVVLADPAFFNK